MCATLSSLFSSPQLCSGQTPLIQAACLSVNMEQGSHPEECLQHHHGHSTRKCLIVSYVSSSPEQGPFDCRCNRQTHILYHMGKKPPIACPRIVWSQQYLLHKQSYAIAIPRFITTPVCCMNFSQEDMNKCFFTNQRPKLVVKTNEAIEVPYRIIGDPLVHVSLQSLVVIDDDLMGPSFSYSMCSINPQSHLQLRGEMKNMMARIPREGPITPLLLGVLKTIISWGW